VDKIIKDYKILISVEADTNDGDYVTEINYITEETLKQIKPVIKAIKKCSDGNNFRTGEMASESDSAKSYYVGEGHVTQEEFDAFYELVSSGEYGVHTIEEIKIYKVLEEISLL
jgi:hypothetical protein